MISKYADPLYDRYTPLSGWAGLPAEQLSTAYTNKIMVGLASTAISFATTEMGKRWLQGLIAVGMMGVGFFGADRLGLDRRTRIDLHDMAATFGMLAVDPSLREIKDFQEDLIGFVEDSKRDGVVSSLKKHTMLDKGEMDAFLREIHSNNEVLEDLGVPGFRWLNKLTRASPGLPALPIESKSEVRGNGNDRPEKQMRQMPSIEKKYLTNDIEIRGGF